MPDVTSATTLSLISWNSSKALEFLESPCKSEMTCIPSSSLSLSRSHLYVTDEPEIYEMWLQHRYVQHLGLSGSSNDPAASIAPITDWRDRGIRQARLELINEQR